MKIVVFLLFQILLPRRKLSPSITLKSIYVIFNVRQCNEPVTALSWKNKSLISLGAISQNASAGAAEDQVRGISGFYTI